MSNQPADDKIQKAEQIKTNIKRKTEWGFLDRELPTFYVNNANIAISDFDVRIDLGEIQGMIRSDDGLTLTTQVAPRVRLFLAPLFAERLINLVQRALEKRSKSNQSPSSDPVNNGPER